MRSLIIGCASPFPARCVSYIIPHFLESVVNDNLTWKDAIGEWIDNALDAKAMRITIEFAKNCIRIADDGIGCSDPAVMVQLGSHERHASTRLGRYGIGGKDAALWAGGTVDATIEISSVHAGVRRTLELNWRDFAVDWECDDPKIEPSGELDKGTMITITSHRRRNPPHGEKWSELIASIGYTFSPALKEGRQILLKRPNKTEWEAATRWQLPQFEGETIEQKLDINGRHARVRCGVVAAGVPNPMGGFTYFHGWRVIEKASANGCGRFSTARICGVVQLDGNWPLTRHKDAISKDADQLYQAVEDACLPVLQRGDMAGTAVDSASFLAAANAQLNAILEHVGMAKAKRAKRTKSEKQAVRATGEGSQHERAKREQPGQTFRAKRGRYKIEYGQFGSDTIGQIRPPSAIVLNEDNPVVADTKSAKNMPATVVLALSMLTVEQCWAPAGQPDLLAGIERGPTTEAFAKGLGKLLASGLTIDGKPTLQVVA